MLLAPIFLASVRWWIVVFYDGPHSYVSLEWLDRRVWQQSRQGGRRATATGRDYDGEHIGAKYSAGLATSRWKFSSEIGLI